MAEAIVKFDEQGLKCRKNCPFYGFHTSLGILIDQEGNECALITDSYSPCQMEYNGLEPNWSKCNFNNVNNVSELEKGLALVRVFPKELMPKDKPGWGGLSLGVWIGLLYLEKTTQPQK